MRCWSKKGRAKAEQAKQQMSAPSLPFKGIFSLLYQWAGKLFTPWSASNRFHFFKS